MEKPDDQWSERRGGWRLAGLLVGVLGLVLLLQRPWADDGVIPVETSGQKMHAAPEAQGAMVMLAMSIEGETLRTLPLQVVKGQTLLETMIEVARQDPVWLCSTVGQGEEAFITSLGGRTNGEAGGHYWTYEVNGRRAEIGAGAYRMQDGDAILWKFGPYE